MPNLFAWALRFMITDVIPNVEIPLLGALYETESVLVVRFLIWVLIYIERLSLCKHAVANYISIFGGDNG